MSESEAEATARDLAVCGDLVSPPLVNPETGFPSPKAKASGITRRESKRENNHQTPSHHNTHSMPPKGAIRGTGVGRPVQQGYARQVINEVTSPENRSVVTAVTFFAVSNEVYDRLAAEADTDLYGQAGVAFLHSSWSEILLPP